MRGTLLNGLERNVMRSASHVLGVIIRRLEQSEKDMRQARLAGWKRTSRG